MAALSSGVGLPRQVLTPRNECTLEGGVWLRRFTVLHRDREILIYAALGSPSREAAVMMKIILIDDQQLFREGFRELLSHEADMTIVSEGNDAADGIAAARSKDPDLVIYDLLPGIHGLQLARDLLSDRPSRCL